MLKKFKLVLAEKKPENIFLLFGSIFIGAFIIIIPALQGWDEATHFLRAYQVSEANIFPDRFDGNRAGGPVPVDISELHDSAVSDLIMSARTNLERKAHLGFYVRYAIDTQPDRNIVEKSFEGSAVYSPLSYVPQALGITIARFAHMPLLTYVYIGRIMNALVFLVLVYWAIKLSPKGKWALTAIAMLPTSLTAAASLSPDVLINAGAILMASLFIKVIFEKSISRAVLLSVLGLSITLAITKQAYFLFSFMFLFVPPKVYGTTKRYLLWNGLIISISLALMLGWYLMIDDIAKNIHIAHKANMHISSTDQIKFILTNPIKYSAILLWQLIGRINPQYTQLTGILTWKGIVMPQPIILLVYMGLIFAFISARAEMAVGHLKKFSKVAASWGPVLLALSTIVLIYTVLYLTFTPVGQSRIDGVQGRYFISVLPLLVPATLLWGRNIRPLFVFDQLRMSRLLISIFVLQNTFALFAVVATNYIPNIQFV